MRVDFSWTPEEQAFRTRVRTFVEEHWARYVRPGDPEAAAWERTRAYERKLSENGWLTMAWPREFGGTEASVVEQMIFAEESALYGAPASGFGPRMTGPTIMAHGTQEQQRQHLPRIANCEVNWCQGFSEPGAGSDLASLQTRAVREGDEYVINGQKIWTSQAQHADWIMLLARTDPDAPKHRGITYFLVDLKTPGITIRPIIQLHNESGFNETFFEDVRVPRANVVGEENRGWYVATTTLDFERSGVHRAAAVERGLNPLLEYARAEGDAVSSAKRLGLADIALRLNVGRLFGYRVSWMQASGMIPNHEASMSKVFNSELLQQTYQRGVGALGLFGQLTRGSAHVRLNGAITHGYMHTLSATIAAGTSEVQRNIIATRGLGLPRG